MHLQTVAVAAAAAAATCIAYTSHRPRAIGFPIWLVRRLPGLYQQTLHASRKVLQDAD